MGGRRRVRSGTFDSPHFLSTSYPTYGVTSVNTREGNNGTTQLLPRVQHCTLNSSIPFFFSPPLTQSLAPCDKITLLVVPCSSKLSSGCPSLLTTQHLITRLFNDHVLLLSPQHWLHVRVGNTLHPLFVHTFITTRIFQLLPYIRHSRSSTCHVD
ncbi:hypothetical protein EmuJ_000198000 [Echinococcus multilocularis]|uniref:Uncharacterized protein n=1 Tax=Echinococcus multilocularis TaxID=6211 RepID=A0A087W0S8_ECHMU|nr:hypothetical protein EmuJ_000198000 [Echinococcus multilocularis]